MRLLLPGISYYCSGQAVSGVEMQRELSDDDGMSWAPPRDITADVKPDGWSWYATGPGHGIQLSAGQLLIPSDHGQNGVMSSHVIYSDDHGDTWQQGGILPRFTEEANAYEGPSAYSDLAILPDMTIGLLFESGDDKYYERIVFTRFTLEWLTNGTDGLP